MAPAETERLQLKRKIVPKFVQYVKTDFHRIPNFPLLTTESLVLLSLPFMVNEEINRSLTPQELDFTHAHIMSRYVTETGKILPRKMTRLSSKQQRKINKAIKRARNMLTMQ
tara:strand:- start:10965 stop:11300 length:336 start_codon:yes stop_codon:yes gene_type:complete